MTPWFLLPCKRYPIQVYVYAINLYSSNPEMSQRAVAKATRNVFNLKKFSHSTVCRTLKAIEETIKKAAAANGRPLPARIDNATLKERKKFPSIIDTAERRKTVSVFLKSMYKKDTDGIEEISLKIVIKWYDRYMRLLI